MCNIKNKTISQHLKEYFERNELFAEVIYGKTIIRILSIINGTADNFFIFNNAGGKRFDIWFMEDLKQNEKKFLKLIKSKQIFQYVYMYKINGKETIVKNL